MSNLTLVDPEFGVPGSVDILFGADAFSHTMLHGRRFGPSQSPSEEQTVVTHFERNHSKDKTGRFIVPLPIKKDASLLGEAR